MSNLLFTKYGGVNPYIIILVEEHRYTKFNLPFEEGHKKDPKLTITLTPGTILCTQDSPFTEYDRQERSINGFHLQWGFGPCYEKIPSSKIKHIELINIEELYSHTNNTTTLEKLPKTLSDNIYLLIDNLSNEISNKNKIGVIQALIKYHKEYGIWNTDNSFNSLRFDIFIKDHEAGILN